MIGFIICQGGLLFFKYGSREEWVCRGYGGYSKIVNCKLVGIFFRKMFNINKDLKSK